MRKKLDSLDLQMESEESGLTAKIFRVVEWAQEMELELEDWKRNYWILEKKLNQLELRDES